MLLWSATSMVSWLTDDAVQNLDCLSTLIVGLATTASLRLNDGSRSFMHIDAVSYWGVLTALLRRLRTSISLGTLSLDAFCMGISSEETLRPCIRPSLNRSEEDWYPLTQ